MTNPILNGPQALYNNVPINPEYFQPSKFQITAITPGRSTTVTVAASFGVNCNYVVGQRVKFVIPSPYGAYQLNGQSGYVTSLPATNQFVVDIDTSLNFSSFVASPTYGPTPPQVIATGDINSGIISSTGASNSSTTIPGAFINISP